jgi:hypothetical protein
LGTAWADFGLLVACRVAEVEGSRVLLDFFDFFTSIVGRTFWEERKREEEEDRVFILIARLIRV